MFKNKNKINWLLLNKHDQAVNVVHYHYNTKYSGEMTVKFLTKNVVIHKRSGEKAPHLQFSV